MNDENRSSLSAKDWKGNAVAVNWKAAIKPAAQSVEFKSAAAQMKPAERIANGMDLAAFKNGESTKKRPAIVQKGSEVRFCVRYGNRALTLVESDTQFVAAADKFDSVYAAIKEAVLNGEFDTQIAELAANAKKRAQAMAASRKAKAATKQ